MAMDVLRHAQQFDDRSMAGRPQLAAKPTHRRHAGFMGRHQHVLVASMPESP
jgi:hypothetical protein